MLVVKTTIEFDEANIDFALPQTPARSERHKFQEKQIKFPKKNNLYIKQNTGIALNSFANHELLAIEMMAAALLIYPHHTPELKRFKLGIIKTLQDEQRHFKLYRTRLNEIGYDFGDFPLNDFFWNQMPKLKTPSQYLAVMALTFEAANLDFASYYRDIFYHFDDHVTGNILEEVFQDEISHVQFGAYYLNLWKQDKSLWNYYLESLPWPLTPARSKGINFNLNHRKMPQMDQDFLDSLNAYQDDFPVTNRSKK